MCPGGEEAQHTATRTNRTTSVSDCVGASPVAAEALHVVLAAALSRGYVALLGAARGRASTLPGGVERKREGMCECVWPPEGAVGSLRV